MTSLSDLNKQERDIRGNITRLRRELREKKILKKDFDKSFESFSDKLERISEEKSSLIGLPPLPPKPMKKDSGSSMPSPSTNANHGGFGLDLIKKSILGGSKDGTQKGTSTQKGAGTQKGTPSGAQASKPSAPEPEPIGLPDIPDAPPKPKISKDTQKGTPKQVPQPPVSLRLPKTSKSPIRSLPKPPKAKEKVVKAPVIKEVIKEKVVEVPVIKEVDVPVIKEKIKEIKVPIITEKIKRVEVPVIKEVIKEVPVIKEVIKEVKVPVIKEVKVPVIKEVKVPAGDPGMAKKIEESIKSLNELRVDMATRTQELSQLSKSMDDTRKRVRKMEDSRIDAKVLAMRVDKMDFQGLSHDIYNQFSTLKKFMEESIKNNTESHDQDSDLSTKIVENTEDIRDIQSDFARIEKETTGFLKEVRESVQKVREMEDMKGEIEELDARMKGIDFEGLTHEIYKQFEKMNVSINESEVRASDFMEKLKVEMKVLEDKIGEAAQAKEHVDNLDITTIRRDMESLKQKSQYIEQNLENVNLEPIMTLIKEVENKVETLRVSSPLIIE